jgi:hypothetical protein
MGHTAFKHQNHEPEIDYRRRSRRKAEVMTTRPDTVTTELSLRLVIPGSASLPVTADMRYDITDPYAVHVGFRTGGDEVVEWTFARQLLTEGVTQPAGEGDVRVWPTVEGDSQLVCLALSSPSGQALFELPLTGLVEFLSRTYASIPTGTESDFVDLDTELALLMWTDPTA